MWVVVVLTVYSLCPQFQNKNAWSTLLHPCSLWLFRVLSLRPPIAPAAPTPCRPGNEELQRLPCFPSALFETMHSLVPLASLRGWVVLGGWKPPLHPGAGLQTPRGCPLQIGPLREFPK